MDYSLFLIENPLDLCFEANKLVLSERLRIWAASSTGRAFGMAIAEAMLEELTPAFFPIRDCKDYLSELTEFDMVDIKANGVVSERVAISVIHICRSLFPKILFVPYLQPYQLDAYIVRSTLTIYIYCYTRLSRPCSHREAVKSIQTISGTSTETYNVEEGDSDNKIVFEYINSIVGSPISLERLFSSN
ncbi:hypothetical protein F5B18DRAFT_664520 [Nemania serpens]|nr:hypothetical protein F5B18DRAFT_664520 [Nemania serpens]